MNQEVQSIISGYRKFSYYVFNIGVILIPFIVALIFGATISADEVKNVNNVQSKVQNYKQLGNVYYGNPLYSSKFGAIKNEYLVPNYIKGFVDGSDLKSYDALVTTNQGIVLPNSYGYYDNSFFDKLEVETGENQIGLYMDALKNPLTFTKISQYSGVVNYKTASSLRGTKIMDKYGLSCITNKLKVSNYFCDQAVEKFISDIPFVDMSQDNLNFVKIMSKLSPTQLSLACENVYKFTQNSGKSLKDNMIVSCSDQFKNEYENLNNFIFANQQINGNYSSIINSTDKKMQNLLNEYMLVSYIQKVVSSKYSQIQVTNYINFILDILQQKQLQKGFYADLANYFNNVILLNEINKTGASENSDWIKNTKTSINDINQGKGADMDALLSLSSYNWDNQNEIQISNTPITTRQEQIEQVLKSVSNFTYIPNSLSRLSSTDTTSTWTYSGYYQLQDSKNSKFYIVGNLLFKNNNYYLNSISSTKNEVDNDVNKKLSQNLTSLNQAFDIIQNSYNLYGNIVSFCESLDPTIKIKSCSEDKIIFDLNGEIIMVNFDGNAVYSIQSSNKNLQSFLKLINISVLSKKQFSVIYSSINESYNKYKNTQVTSSVAPSNDPVVSISEQNKIYTLFKPYTPVTIVKKLTDNTFTVEFKAQDLTLRAVLNLALNNKVDTFFDSTTTPAKKIYGLEFFLIPDEGDTFGEFVKNPWPTIQSSDPNYYNQMHTTTQDTTDSSN